MIRFINCLRRRPDITSEEFRAYWNDPKLDAIIARVMEYTGASGYAKNLTLMVAANDLMRQRRAFGEPFDAVLEYWWDDAARLRNVLNSDQCELLMQAMLEFQKQFVDLKNSSAFFTEAQE